MALQVREGGREVREGGGSGSTFSSACQVQLMLGHRSAESQDAGV